MEVRALGSLKMDDKIKMESVQFSAAFVEGDIQDAYDDSCSICLESFCESDPATVTSCKHEFHIQCILEWCQRSSQCPMCWQPISLQDSTSQELLEAVERERSFRANQSHNTAIFHHPSLGEFELQHLPIGATDSDLEERIIQHLAAAAAMRRAQYGGRRGLRSGPASQDRSQFLVFSSAPSFAATNDQFQQGSSSALPIDRPVIDSTSANQDRAGPSDFQSFSDTLKSRLNAVSLRYKESISKSTRGWKERLFSRGTTMADIGSEVRREVSAGIATVSRMMERIDSRENNSSSGASVHGISRHFTVRTSTDGHSNTGSSST